MFQLLKSNLFFPYLQAYNISTYLLQLVYLPTNPYGLIIGIFCIIFIKFQIEGCVLLSIELYKGIKKHRDLSKNRDGEWCF